MARDQVLQIRLSVKERDKLQAYAEARGWTMAQVLRDLIRQLPEEKPSRRTGFASQNSR